MSLVPHPFRRFKVIMADTSYSDMRAPDFRGEAVSEVQILPDGSVKVHGRLQDRRSISYRLAPVPTMTDLVGLRRPLGSNLLKPLPSSNSVAEVSESTSPANPA